MQACNKTLFWGGTYENVCLHFFSSSLLQDCILIGSQIAIMYPHVLPTCNYFPGGRPILQVAFYGNKCKNMEKMQAQQSGGLQIAAELHKIIIAICIPRGPQLPVIFNEFYTFSSFTHVIQIYRRYIIPCKLLENP